MKLPPTTPNSAAGPTTAPATGATTPAATVQAPNSAPIQSHISNWERDLVASRSAARTNSEARVNTAQWATIGATVVGVGALLVGQVHIALAVWGVGILLSPGNEPTDRHDPR